MKSFVYIVLSSLLLSTQVQGARPTKVSVCHFAEEEGVWVLLSLPPTAVTAHLRQHDDAVVDDNGGVTIVTGTQLDGDCQPVVETFPE